MWGLATNARVDRMNASDTNDTASAPPHSSPQIHRRVGHYGTQDV